MYTSLFMLMILSSPVLQLLLELPASSFIFALSWCQGSRSPPHYFLGLKVTRTDHAWSSSHLEEIFSASSMPCWYASSAALCHPSPLLRECWQFTVQFSRSPVDAMEYRNIFWWPAVDYYSSRYFFWCQLSLWVPSCSSWHTGQRSSGLASLYGLHIRSSTFGLLLFFSFCFFRVLIGKCMRVWKSWSRPLDCVPTDRCCSIILRKHSLTE
jgi:hypothetical protein